MANPKPIKPPQGIEFEDLPDNTDGGISAWQDATNKKLSDIEQLTKYILVVGVVALFSVAVACVGLVLDQMHFNNQTYNQEKDRKQSQKPDIFHLHIEHLVEPNTAQ